MTTKGQELKKELAQAFPKLKFSVKTDKGITTRIDVIVTGLVGSPYTMSEIKLVTNKYHNYRTHGHNDSHTGNTQVHVKNERSYYLKEIKEMVPNYESNWSTVYKIADNECFTVLPDGYYEEKMSLQNSQTQEVIDSAATKTIEKETIDTNDKWFDELFSDLTVDELVKEIESRMELIINNCFGDIFHSEISVNRLGNLLVATIDGVKYRVPSLLDALCNYTNEDFDNGGYYDLSDYLWDCEYIPEDAKADIESQYHEYLQDKLSRKEYDTIITLEAFKDEFASIPVKFIFP